MNKDLFEKNKATLLAALTGLTERLRPAKYPDGVTPKGRTSRGRKKTKKGSTHKIGKHFIPKHITSVKIDLQGHMGYVTPALYRRLHLGVAKKRTPVKHVARGRNVGAHLQYIDLHNQINNAT